MAENRMERMRELVSLLNRASEAYYAKDEEIISNFEYDKLYDELTALEKELGVTLAESPSAKVGYEAVEELPKELNVGPMTKRKGSVAVHPAINLIAEEGEAVKEAVSMGAHVFFSQVPEQGRIEWDEVKDKF